MPPPPCFQHSLGCMRTLPPSVSCHNPFFSIWQSFSILSSLSAVHHGASLPLTVPNAQGVKFKLQDDSVTSAGAHKSRVAFTSLHSIYFPSSPFTYTCALTPRWPNLALDLTNGCSFEHQEHPGEEDSEVEGGDDRTWRIR